MYPTFSTDDLQRDDLSQLTLGAYDLGKKLGEGGMGSLFHATHRQLGKHCAIKFIQPSMTTNGQAIGRFLQEIQAVGQLNHPNIVCAFDAGCCDGVHYYVTEFLAGQDLQKFITTRGPFDWEASVPVMRQVLEGLAHAHASGFIHRDIKPSNIFLTESQTVKLLDFGLARHIQQGSGLTSPEQLLGTLDYLAPEQAENANKVNEASDIYSLGLTWIFLLSGQSPFPDQAYSTTVSKLKAHLVDDPAWLKRNPLGLPANVIDLLACMIAKKPAERFQTCQAVIAELDACVSVLSKTGPTNRASSGNKHATPIALGITALALTIGALGWAFSNVPSAPERIEQAAASSPPTTEPAVAKPDSIVASEPVQSEPSTNSEAHATDTTARTLSSAQPSASARVRQMKASQGSQPSIEMLPHTTRAK